MPVPVPRVSKPLAHPVIKQSHRGITNEDNSFQNLTRTLPVSPTGPPPSLGTREEWINSLPSWRRRKPRRIWEDDTRDIEQHQSQGDLIESAESSVTDNTHVRACESPLHLPLETPALVSPVHSPLKCDGDADDEMSSDSSVLDQSRYDIESQWSATSQDVNMENRSQSRLATRRTVIVGPIPSESPIERGPFTPVFEEEPELASSPLEPVTPFGQFVDRAVAAAQIDARKSAHSDPVMGRSSHLYGYQDPCALSCCQAQSRHPVEQPMNPPPIADSVAPGATAAYKKLAEPLADWVANYVWKACTTGMSLPSAFSRPNAPAKLYPPSPPSYLAASVHSLLLSTLLQPSAVFLAIWYIVRLPVYFDAVGLSPDHVKETHFRTELLGDSHIGLDREVLEASAPFRLILLGCMLANKWLDDHTFSNKTWHLISNVPIHSLNKLELVTLDMFSHDLSIPSHTWSQWLAHVISYHLSLASPSHTQPISRPSTNPHTMIRLTMESLTQAPVACNPPHRLEPVFLGLEERRKEKLEEEVCADRCVDVLEIDLDEDGPLREEYLPKRRVSGAGSAHSSVSQNTSASQMLSGHVNSRTGGKYGVVEKTLPPPAKWSPAGDEPILRERSRVSGHYLAVRPPLTNSITPFAVAPYHQVSQLGYQNWTSGGYIPVKLPSMPFMYDLAHHHHIDPALNPYPYALPTPASHARSHSHPLNQSDTQSRNHVGPYSQPQFEYQCHNMAASEFRPANASVAQWLTIDSYTSHGYPLAPGLGVRSQTTWLKT